MLGRTEGGRMICESCGKQMVEEYSSGDSYLNPTGYMCNSCGKSVVNPDLIYVKIPGGSSIRVFASDYATVYQLKDVLAERMHVRAENWGIYEAGEKCLVRVTDEDQLLKYVHKHRLRFFPNVVIR